MTRSSMPMSKTVSKQWLLGVLEWARQRNRLRTLAKEYPSDLPAWDSGAFHEERRPPSAWRRISEALRVFVWLVASPFILVALVVAQAVLLVIGTGLLVWTGWLAARDYARALRLDWRTTLWVTGSMLLAAAGFVLVVIIIGSALSGKSRECIETRYYSTC